MLLFQHFGPLGISTTNLTTGPLSVIQQSCSAHNNRLMEMVYGSTFPLKNYISALKVDRTIKPFFLFPGERHKC
jgi:hypothetical protein